MRERLIELTAGGARTVCAPLSRSPTSRTCLGSLFNRGRKVLTIAATPRGAYEELARQFGLDVAFDVDFAVTPDAFSGY